MNNNTSNNYYTQPLTPKSYILNPFDFIYGEPELPITDVALQEILQGVIDIDEERLDLDLDYLEHLLKLDSLSYIRQGAIYAEIYFKGLYKKKYKSFELYCKDILHKSIDSVRNYIKAARVAIELIMAGFEYCDLPHNMSCAVVLSKWTGPELIKKWQYVLSNLEGHERTAPSIKRLLEPPSVAKDISTIVKLPFTVYTALLEVAYHANMSAEKVIESVIVVYHKISNKAEIGRLINWILDLNKLVDEY